MADPSDTRPTAADVLARSIWIDHDDISERRCWFIAESGLGRLEAATPGDGPLVILGDGTMTRAEWTECPACVGTDDAHEADNCRSCGGTGDLFRIEGAS